MRVLIFIGVIVVICLVSSVALASTTLDSNSKIFDDGIWWIQKDSSESHLGMMEVYLDGEYKGECSRLELGHKVEGVDSWPTVAVIYSSGYLRLKECKPDVNFGTSFVLGPGYWDGGYYHNVSIERVDIDSSDLSMQIKAVHPHFNVSYDIDMLEPTEERLKIHVNQTYECTNELTLSQSRINKTEGFKIVQFSSMYINGTYHDSDGLKYIDEDGELLIKKFGDLKTSRLIIDDPQKLGESYVECTHSDDLGWQGNTPNCIISLDNLSLARNCTPQGRINITGNQNEDNVGFWIHHDKARLEWDEGDKESVSYFLIAQDDPKAPVWRYVGDANCGGDTPCYSSIQAAINAANENDTVIVKDGTYPENVNVTKKLIIRSENGSDNCIIDAGGNGSAVTLRKDGITLDGFITTNSSSLWGDSGIEVVSNANKVTNNNVVSNIRFGIYLGESNYNIVSNNNVSNNNFGVYLDGLSNGTLTNNNVSNNNYGIYLRESSGCTISNNDVSNNAIGIRSYYSSNSTLTNNNVLSNYDGIYLGHAKNNIIINNGISLNYDGIYLSDSSYNMIYLNDFVNNNNSFYLSNSTNTWNSNHQIIYTYDGSTFTNYLGNYWDDYNASDLNGDGVGDTSYSINGDNDDYPLMQPFKNYVEGEIPPPIDGIHPKDLDKNGLFEDVDGSNTFNFGDVIFFFQNFDSNSVKNNKQYYDFNGDEEVNFGDTVALFNEL